ncbi:MAG: GYD domain-containing protein [Chloroflexota bacterium]|nr:GYD domain-containing protein [Chloroflexota bacterium]
MAHYLMTGSYTSEAWSAQVQNPQNRLEAVTPVFEAAGGSIESAYMSFGESDLVLIVQFPDNVNAASLAIALAAGGGVTNWKTTPLISMDDGVSAIKQAGTLTYSPPSK